ncbi:MAG: hypothetical protein WA077_07950 [Anaerolineae bacterium]
MLAQNLIDPKRNTSDAALIVARDAVLTTLTMDGYVTVNADAALRTAVDNATWRMTLPSAQQRHQGAVNSAHFSPDGGRIVSARADDSVRIWDGETGALLATLEGHTAGVWSAAYSPDGKRIVSASADQSVRIWVSTIEELLALAEARIQRPVHLLTDAERWQLGLE